SSVLSYVPLVTPSGKPANVGVVVATPAVPVPATAVALWMCDAVVVPTNPLNVTRTRIVFAVVSKSTSANPVPGEAFVGDSDGPSRKASNVMMPPRAAQVERDAAAIAMTNAA